MMDDEQDLGGVPLQNIIVGGILFIYRVNELSFSLKVYF